MLRDSVEVPKVLEKCAEAIELYGLESMGIYRLSGTTSRVQRLKGALDRGEFSNSFHQPMLPELMRNLMWDLQTSKELIYYQKTI